MKHAGVFKDGDFSQTMKFWKENLSELLEEKKNKEGIDNVKQHFETLLMHETPLIYIKFDDDTPESDMSVELFDWRTADPKSIFKWLEDLHRMKRYVSVSSYSINSAFGNGRREGGDEDASDEEYELDNSRKNAIWSNPISIILLKCCPWRIHSGYTPDAPIQSKS